MGLREILLRRNKKGDQSVLVVRVFRADIHCYSILASDREFEYVFRTGKDRWSTISPSFARRILKRNSEGEWGHPNPRSARDFLALTEQFTQNSNWSRSREIKYADRAVAIQTERAALDESFSTMGDVDVEE